jgi:hypothetical protein
MIICHHPKWGILTYFLVFQHAIVPHFSKSHGCNFNLEEPKPGRPKGQGLCHIFQNHMAIISIWKSPSQEDLRAKVGSPHMTMNTTCTNAYEFMYKNI